MGRSFRVTGGGVTPFAGGEQLSSIAPAFLQASTNDYAPPMAGEASLILIGATTAVNLTGLKGALANREVTLLNVSGSTITVVSESGASTAGNLFNIGANIALTQWSTVTLLANLAAGGWVLKGTSISAGGGGGSSAALLGPLIVDAPASGVTNNLNPGSGFPGSSATPTGRLDINTAAGNVELTGLLAGIDGQLLLIRNTGANNLQLDNANAGSTAANQFACTAPELILGPGARTVACYYAGSINAWSVG